MLSVPQTLQGVHAQIEIARPEEQHYKISISYLYDLYAPALYGTLLNWVAQEGPAQIILQQTFLSYVHDHLSEECEHEKPFICLLRIARKKYNAYLTHL